jgi:hypothetical protein
MANIDTSSFTNFGTAMRSASRRLKTVVSDALVDVASETAEAIRSNASYSKRIPDSVKVTKMDVGAMITAGGPDAPDAEPIENKGKGFVRHPIFVPQASMPGPSGSWTAKNSHPPFMAPAVLAAQAKVEEAASAALDSVLDGVVTDTDLS